MTDFTRSTPLSLLRAWFDRARLYVRALFVRSVPLERFAHRGRAHDDHHRDDHHDEHLLEHAPAHAHHHLLRSCGPRRWPKVVLGLGVVGGIAAVVCGGLWWRLGEGPIAFDVATPWLTSALAEKFGAGHAVEVGGTVIERDENGRTAIRLRDVVVRDANGEIVASAPKADVGIATGSLLTGRVRTERLSLIGAEMALRIERDGQISVFAAGAGDRPLASIAAVGAAPVSGSGQPASAQDASPAADLPAPNLFTTVLGWLQSLDAAGFDGRDLSEIGLRGGSISVDDRRTGKRLTFDNINLSLTRLRDGGIALGVNSAGTDGPWSLNATVTPMADGFRMVDAVIRDVSPKDVMLALRLGNGELAADVPLSAAVRAELGPDGMPRALQGRIVGGAGRIGDARNAAAGVLIDEMQSEVHWDAASRTLRIPIEVHAGANRLALLGVVAPPAEKGGAWSLSVSQGMVVLASAARPAEPPLMLDRLAVRAHFDPASQHLTIEQFDLRGVGAGVAGSGLIDFSGAQAQLKVGIAATSMSAVAFKRLWPAVVTPQLREWIEQNVLNGTVEKVDISTNMPLTAMLPDTPPLTNGSLWIGIKAKGATMRPIEGLPPVRDADIEAQVNGRSASLIFGRGTLDLPSGRKLTIAGGSFDVADVSVPRPPARGRVRVEGGLDAVGELLNMEPLRHSGSSLPFDLNTTRGTIAAQVGVAFPLYKGVGRSAVRYAVEAEVANFAAEKFFRGLKGEAPHLRVNATQDLLQIKGDMRIGGTPAAVDYRMARGASDAEVRIQAALDETLRSKLGLDLGSALSGTIPVKLAGRMKVGDRDGQETRLNVEADLTPARITDLVPGWSKPPGRSARTSFVLVDKGHSIRLEDFTLDGSGANVRGNLEIDSDGELISASLPTFAVSDGDKASLKAERGNDGVLRLTLRGDLYDGRGLVKSSVAGHKPDKRTRGADLDLDIKVGAMTGYHGEALRSLDLKMSRRGGNIRSFSMTGKLGRDARISGDLRGRGSGGRMVIYLEAHDAGALFRFTDIYARIYGGSVSIAMDPPVLDASPREGLLNVKDFYVRGERVLDSVAASGVDPNNPNAQRGLQAGQGVFFSRLRAEFTRSPGRFAIREGVVWGPNIGATVDGHIDYTRDEARLRGTFVPAYALNNLFSRLPVLGFFLGGNENEGLLGVTFQVVGTPTNPILQVNPMSAVAPGFLRKLFEFRGAGGDGAGERTGQIPQQFR